MRILHTADLHIGQTLYQYYDRADEHRHFFTQLINWIKIYEPDLLIIAGDVFDISQPSAACWKLFTESFVTIRRTRPEMAIVIIAGNHDSASRLQSHSDIWALADTYVVGTPPPMNFQNLTGWEENYILRLDSGYVIMLPYSSADRYDAAIRLQEYVAKENRDHKPVVMTGHLTVTGADCAGHDVEIGMLKSIAPSRLGNGFDYLALGHIHRPQTLSHPEDFYSETVVYHSPVIRYSGSALHVSCDEEYPHTVSLVDIPGHQDSVTITQLRINQLRHFVTLPKSGEEYKNEKELFKKLSKFVGEYPDSCYLRFRVKHNVELSSDFNNRIYRLLEESGKDIRYNPRIIWSEAEATDHFGDKESRGEMEVEDLQQMTNPMEFIKMTSRQYPALNLDLLPQEFLEIEKELEIMAEEAALKSSKS